MVYIGIVALITLGPSSKHFQDRPSDKAWPWRLENRVPHNWPTPGR